MLLPQKMVPQKARDRHQNKLIRESCIKGIGLDKHIDRHITVQGYISIEGEILNLDIKGVQIRIEEVDIQLSHHESLGDFLPRVNPVEYAEIVHHDTYPYSVVQHNIDGKDASVESLERDLRDAIGYLTDRAGEASLVEKPPHSRPPQNTASVDVLD
jgi:hypothetical protein